MRTGTGREYRPNCGGIDAFLDIGDATDMLQCAACGFWFHREGLRQHPHERREEVLELDGSTLSRGFARGPAVVITDAKSMDGEIALSGEEIIVTDRFAGPLTRVENFRGVVSTTEDRGSVAAVTSRDRAVPAIGGCPEALDRIENGQIVEIDGEGGKIRMLGDESNGMGDFRDPPLEIQNALEIWLR